MCTVIFQGGFLYPLGLAKTPKVKTSAKMAKKGLEIGGARRCETHVSRSRALVVYSMTRMGQGRMELGDYRAEREENHAPLFAMVAIRVL